MTATTASGVTVTELPPATRIALRTAAPAGLPTRIGARDGAALCLGPDEWLLEGDGAAALVAAQAAPFSAVDVSDREITYALEGPAVLDLLATGCPRDLAAMPTGTGARTVFDSVQVVLTREAEDRFHLTVWRSFAPHVCALLALAERELAAGL